MEEDIIVPEEVPSTGAHDEVAKIALPSEVAPTAPSEVAAADAPATIEVAPRAAEVTVSSEAPTDVAKRRRVARACNACSKNKGKCEITDQPKFVHSLLFSFSDLFAFI